VCRWSSSSRWLSPPSRAGGTRRVPAALAAQTPGFWVGNPVGVPSTTVRSNAIPARGSSPTPGMLSILKARCGAFALESTLPCPPAQVSHSGDLPHHPIRINGKKPSGKSHAEPCVEIGVRTLRITRRVAMSRRSPLKKPKVGACYAKGDRDSIALRNRYALGA
jgi:hypothetical protein